MWADVAATASRFVEFGFTVIGGAWFSGGLRVFAGVVFWQDAIVAV